MFKKIVLGGVLVWAGAFVALGFGIDLVNCNDMYDQSKAIFDSYNLPAGHTPAFPPNECIGTTLENLPSRIKYNMGIS